jgi:hypothetical protein
VPIKQMQRYLKIGTDGVVRDTFAIDVTTPAAPKLQVASHHCSARPPLLREGITFVDANSIAGCIDVHGTTLSITSIMERLLSMPRLGRKCRCDRFQLHAHVHR